MKKTLVFIIALLVYNSTQAQLIKGNWLVRGSGSLCAYNRSHTYAETKIQDKNLIIDMAASLGYFFTDKVVLGLRPGFFWIKSKILSSSIGTEGDVYTTTNLSAGPFGRYYFLNKDKPFNIVADASYLFGIVKYNEVRGAVNTFSAMTGPVIFFNDVAGIELLIGYSSRKENVKASFEDSQKGFRAEIGFQIHLEKTAKRNFYQ